MGKAWRLTYSKNRKKLVFLGSPEWRSKKREVVLEGPGQMSRAGGQGRASGFYPGQSLGG